MSAICNRNNDLVIHVGTDGTFEAVQVPRALLLENCETVQARIAKGDIDRLVYIVKPDDFKVYIKWLETGDLLQAKEKWLSLANEHVPKDKEYRACLELLIDCAYEFEDSDTVEELEPLLARVDASLQRLALAQAQDISAQPA